MSSDEGAAQGLWKQRRGVDFASVERVDSKDLDDGHVKLDAMEDPMKKDKEGMIELDTLDKAREYTELLQPNRPPADAKLSHHLADVGIDGCAAGLFACWLTTRSVGVEVQVLSCTNLPAPEVGRHMHIVWRIADGRMRGSVPAEVRPLRQRAGRAVSGHEARAQAISEQANDQGDFEAAILTMHGDTSERGREGLKRLACVWNYHFVFVRTFLAFRSTGYIVWDHQPIVFDIIESGMPPKTFDGTTAVAHSGRVLGSVAVNMRDHIKMINPWEGMSHEPYEVQLREPPKDGDPVPLLHVKVKVVTPTTVERQIFKGNEVSARMGLMQEELEVETRRRLLLQEQASSSCQIPSVDGMVLAMREMRCFTAHEFENQLVSTILNESEERKSNLMVTARLEHADQAKMESLVLREIEALLKVDLLNTPSATFKVGSRGQSIVLFLKLESEVHARMVKNRIEEMSITKFPIVAHYSALDEFETGQ